MTSFDLLNDVMGSWDHGIQTTKKHGNDLVGVGVGSVPLPVSGYVILVDFYFDDIFRPT